MVIVYLLIAFMLTMPLGLVGTALGLGVLEAVIVSVMANALMIFGAAVAYVVSGKADTPEAKPPHPPIPEPVAARPHLTLVPPAPRSARARPASAIRRHNHSLRPGYRTWPAVVPAGLHHRLLDALSYRSVSPDDIWDEVADWLDEIGAVCPLDPVQQPDGVGGSSPLVLND